MKLRFRLPDEGEEEGEDYNIPDETGEEPDLEVLVPKVLALAVAAASAQVFWPLPLPFVVIFAVLGLGLGVAWLLRVGTWAAMSAFVFYVLVDLFTPANASVGFLLRATFVTVATFGVAVGAGLLIRRAHGDV